MKWILIVGLVCLGAYELWAIVHEATGDTISELVWAAGERSDLLPFSLGLLAGHFVWPRRKS